MKPTLLFLSLPFAIVFLCAWTGPSPSAQSAAPTESRAAASGGQSLDRVVVLGASVSAGFQDFTSPPHPLQAYLSQILTGIGEPVSTFADATFFISPLSVGSRQVQSALAKKPTLVLAADFLFWYGYGDMATDEDRIVQLDKGLDELKKFECPVVVGDLPDVSPGVGKMIRASQVPSKESLIKLNSHLTKWASLRANVIVLPFSGLLPKLYRSEAFKAGPNRWVAGDSGRLVHTDLLHLTDEGTAALSVLLLEAAFVKVQDSRAGKLNLETSALVKPRPVSSPSSKPSR